MLTVLFRKFLPLNIFILQTLYRGENTRIIYDLMQFTEERNIPGLLLMIDFEKAFDSVSWQIIDKALNVFNFGPSIRRWISVFQYETISAITQFFLSIFFKIRSWMPV